MAGWKPALLDAAARTLSSMTFRQRRIFGWLVLLAFAAAGAAWLLQLDYEKKISTDVLDLIPAEEREPELALVRALASEAEARTMLFALSDASGKPAAPEATRRFAAALSASTSFAQTV